MHVILETPRLILRRFTEEDAPLIYKLNSDPEVLKYLHERKLEDLDDARQIIRTVILPQYEQNLGRWAIHIRSGNDFIGWCGLKYRPELDETDLGYRLMTSYWGNGYASEAAGACLDLGLRELKIPLITACRAHIENLASIRVLEKIGMEFLKLETVDHCPVRTYIAGSKAIL